MAPQEPLPLISKTALFRYHVVSHVRSRLLSGMGRMEAVEVVAAATHIDASGMPCKVSATSVYRWLDRLEKKGVAGLEDEKRPKAKSSRVLSPEFLSLAVRKKLDDPRVSLPEVIRIAREKGILASNHPVSRITLWRAMRRLGTETGRRKDRKNNDARRFAYPHRMQMVLCDGKHFRAGVKRARRVAFFFLDDSTRYALHVVVGTSEKEELFLRGLYETIRAYGRMSIMYVDCGPGFIGLDSIQIAANIDFALVNGTAGYPEGRGKVERFNRTADQGCLRHLDGRPDVDPAATALELRISHFMQEVYNNTPHEALDNRTPKDRFLADQRPLRMPGSDEDLRGKFIVHLDRRVSADNIVSVDSTPYEMPIGYAGARVSLSRHLLDRTILFLHAGRLIRLLPVDLAGNAKTPRAGPDKPSEEKQNITYGAADAAFDNDFGPIVEPDGGFSDDDPAVPVTRD